jgi:hypothetical protein
MHCKLLAGRGKKRLPENAKEIAYRRNLRYTISLFSGKMMQAELR